MSYLWTPAPTMPDECNSSEVTPKADDYLDAINTTTTVFMGVSGLVCLLTLVLFIENVHFIMKHYKGKFLRMRTMVILGVYPTVSLCCMLTLIFPRSSLLMDCVASICVSIAIYNFITLIPEYFRGIDNMLHVLKDERVSLGVMPFICLRCTPLKLTLNWKNFVIIMCFGLQSAIIQPLVAIFALVAWFEGHYTKGKFDVDNAYGYLTVIRILSTFTVIYGINLLVSVCRFVLSELNMGPKLRTLQLVIVFKNIQSVILTNLAKNDIPECRGILSSRVRGEIINNIILIFEMFLLGILARVFYRKPHSSRYLEEGKTSNNGDAQTTQRPEVATISGSKVHSANASINSAYQVDSDIVKEPPKEELESNQISLRL